ncbi:Imm7 family immunity protein [Streptosporangium carneum]|uniref:Imm7 family immunity protein n=1 Tax=Streptosporangium carneum TaxID=47481 RepID=UPI0034D95888
MSTTWSYGVLHEWGDETNVRPGPNAFRAVVMVRGVVSGRRSFLLSVSPLIEDE